MRRVAEDATDDELYAWFLEWLAQDGLAQEMAPGVIEADTSDARVTIHLTRTQLREAAWASHNVFDDTDLNVVPRTRTPVATGMDYFTSVVEELVATLRPGEHHLVYADGDLHRSVRADLPPLRGRSV